MPAPSSKLTTSSRSSSFSRPPKATSPSRAVRIRVVVRVRPSIAEDVDIHYQQLGDQYEECVHEDAERGTVQLRKPFFDTREFSLDVVLGRDCTQAQTYEAVGRPVVDDVIEGFNGTVLAYGQTGTGKTYTVYGPLSYWRRAPVGLGVGGGVGRVAPHTAAPALELQPQLELSGVVTRAAMQIFAHGEELMRRNGEQGVNGPNKMRVTISSCQIWQEAISDLLGERRNSGPLTIREGRTCTHAYASKQAHSSSSCPPLTHTLTLLSLSLLFRTQSTAST